MPAHDRGRAPLDAYLGRLLLAAIKTSPTGELRIKCSDIDAVEMQEHIVKDYDPATNSLILRATGRFTEVWQVNPEAATWIDQNKNADAAAVAARSSIKTDDELAALEERLMRKPFRRSVNPRSPNEPPAS